MPYAINSYDHPCSVDKRMELRPEHLDWLRENTPRLLAAGAKRNEEGEPIGSLVIVDVETIEEAEEIAKADPYSREGLFAKVEITGWNKAFFNFEALV